MAAVLPLFSSNPWLKQPILLKYGEVLNLNYYHFCRSCCWNHFCRGTYLLCMLLSLPFLSFSQIKTRTSSWWTRLVLNKKAYFDLFVLKFKDFQSQNFLVIISSKINEIILLQSRACFRNLDLKVLLALSITKSLKICEYKR